MRFGLLAAAIVAVGCATPAPEFACPEGTHALSAEVPTAGDLLPYSRLVYCALEDGTPHGPFAKWFEGRLWVVGHRDRGELSGTFVAWHENGSKWMVADHENGIQLRGVQWNSEGTKISDSIVKPSGTGESRFWYESGARKFVAEEKDDEFHGRFASWYESGGRRSVGEYRDGQKFGVWTCWDEAGTREIAVLHRDDGTIEAIDPVSRIEPWMRRCTGGCVGERVEDLAMMPKDRSCSSPARSE